LLEHGIETIALRPLVATQLNTNAGLLVVYVEPGTPAAEAGLQPGDVIQSIDGKPVSTFSRNTQALPVQTDKPLILEVVHNKTKRTVTIAPAPKK
jgi:S1-C subfamily serine protease